MKKSTLTMFLQCMALFLFTKTAQAQSPADSLLLRDFQPKSIYKIPKSDVPKARYPAIDVHGHQYEKTAEGVKKWIATMDACNVQKTVIMTGETGAAFDSLMALYGKYPDRFSVWCGIDFRGSSNAGWAEKAIRELERCKKLGATGVGEITDKGRGLYSATERGLPPCELHPDDPQMQPVWRRIAELGLPVNVHIAEPKWMFEPMDASNDGLMNAATWRIRTERPDQLSHEALMVSFDKMMAQQPNLKVIACHLLNCEYDLSILGSMFDKYPNLRADIGARYAEIAPIPRYTARFFEKYSDRILFGTDLGNDPATYGILFRILESSDEHFYEHGMSGYHWALNGLALPDEVLRKLYGENAKGFGL